MVNSIMRTTVDKYPKSKKNFNSKVMDWLKNDIAGFVKLFNKSEIKHGLFSYRLNNSGLKNIHLRINKDGSGILFIDVSDVIYLNSTAVLIAKMALEKIHINDAYNRILSQFKNSNKEELISNVKQIYKLIEDISLSEKFCPSCRIPFADKMPLFSNEVNAPFKVDVALTYKCNNNCRHCYNQPERKNMPSLSLANWFNVVDKIYEASIPYLILTGGEPTLYSDVTEIIKYANELGLVVGMNTNGRNFSNKIFTDNLINAGLNNVQITIESCVKDIHNSMTNSDSFEQTVNGIKNLLNTNVHTLTNTTITKTNHNSILDTIEFLYSIGIRTFAMNSMIYSGCGMTSDDDLSEEELIPLLEQITNKASELKMKFLWYTPTEYCLLSPLKMGLGARRCNAGEYSMCIEPNGDVIPCQSYYEAAGNILTDDWDEIWNSDLFLSFRNRFKLPKDCGLSEKCFECDDLGICGGGCRLKSSKV